MADRWANAGELWRMIAPHDLRLDYCSVAGKVPRTRPRMSDLTLVIGNKNYSSWSLRPWMLLKHLGLEFTERLVILDTPTFKDEIAKFGPSGRVPVLKHGDLTVWDSMAICEYLAELT